jgi:hypothetical protein
MLKSARGRCHPRNLLSDISPKKMAAVLFFVLKFKLNGQLIFPIYFE